jgi:hypothetical protein
VPTINATNVCRTIAHPFDEVEGVMGVLGVRETDSYGRGRHDGENERFTHG